jgi:hypothetical protein
MTFEELKEATKDIDLEILNVSLGKPSNKVKSISCFHDGTSWIIMEQTEKLETFETRGIEDDIMKKMFGKIELLKEN